MSIEPEREELERLRAEVARLREGERRQHSVIAAMNEGVVVHAADGAIVASNAAAERILGLTADQLAGKTSLDPAWRAIRPDGSAFPGDEHPAMVTLRTGRPARDVIMGVHKPDGALTWIAINSEPVACDAQEEHGVHAPRVVATFTDITAHRQALEDLRGADERLTLALHAARMGAWQFEVATQQVIWSSSVEDVFGVPRGSFDGSFDTYLAMIHPEDRSRTQAAIAASLADPKGDDFHVQHRIRGPRGERWLECHARIFRDAHGAATRMAGVAIDVTEARIRELEVRQAQRLEAIGRLAGGIAHDFNNALTAISTAAALAGRAGREPRGELTMIQEAVERAARLTRQLLAFARRRAIGVSTFDLGELVDGLRPLLGHLLGERIELVVEVAPGPWPVRADHGQLEQVLLNLVVNAGDAIAETGRVCVAVAAAPGGADAVVVSIEDDGAGMTTEVLQHVFEPFFTTKERATGLGLASAYGTVEQHGGRIDIRSAVGAGTRVEVTLPLNREQVATAAPAPAPVARAGAETVLLVEDDAAVRELARRTLTEQGYQLLVARDGLEALEVVAGRLDDVAIVVTDVIMPRLGGIPLIRRLRAQRPSLRVLLTSGYAPNADVTASDLPKLDKPYTPATLARAIRAQLDGG